MSKVNSNSSLFLTRHACIPIADSYFVQHETVLFTCSHWVYFDSKSGWCQIIFLATIAQQSRLQYYGLESVTHQWYIQYDQFHQNNQGYFARADTVRVLSIWDRMATLIMYVTSGQTGSDRMCACFQDIVDTLISILQFVFQILNSGGPELLPVLFIFKSN